MKLLLDFGNSRCKWALLDKEQFSDSGAISYVDDGGQPQLVAVTQQLPLVGINSIHIVSVLGKQLDAQIAKALAPYEHYFYTSQLLAHGVKLAYADATQYGNDRYIALLAAHHLYSGSKIIIDCGTATTFDVMDETGQHLGGLIIPGYEAMLNGLVNNTQQLQRDFKIKDLHLLAKNAKEALSCGTMLCIQMGVKGIVDRMMMEMKAFSPEIIATGGAQEEVLASMDLEVVREPDLILKGLSMLARSNDNSL